MELPEREKFLNNIHIFSRFILPILYTSFYDTIMYDFYPVYFKTSEAIESM